MRRTLGVIGCTLALSALAGPSTARACGGFFCSTAPMQQAGETIVYGLEDDRTLTMAVQITYTGADDDFAWILPLPVPPISLGLGTDLLFQQLDSATETIFTSRGRTEGTCRRHPVCVSRSGEAASSYSGGCGFTPIGPSGYTGGYVDAGPPPDAALAAYPDAARSDGGVTVFHEGSLGPYDSVVLGAATAIEVVAWLQEHGYDVPDASIPMLDSYASAGHVFVALRLSAQRTTNLLRPIVLRLPTDEACLPIRLTAIATVPDMPITAFFLGRAPFVPRNYSLAEIPEDPAFWRGTRSWADASRAAVDALGGRAFVPEYAGPTPRVDLTIDDALDLAEVEEPGELMRALQARGYQADAALLDILQRYLAPPAGQTPRGYYNCLAADPIRSCGTPSRFEPAALVAAIDAEITQPRVAAQAMIDRHGHLTRLATTMSADEMTLDPVFVEDAGAPSISNVHRAEIVIECSDAQYLEDAPQVLVTRDGRSAWRPGTISNDDAFCRARGLFLYAPPADMAAEPAPPAGGSCLSCGVAQRGAWRGWVLLAALALVIARRHASARR